ncbi:hypothetical protein IAQ61_007533 [Plenodomus lingam]|uniref:uncharacterized protein n=1 Tax=Leptosphaeria maculans TaxID=5022 RepID=UPI00332B10E1|nr:hypothetical protein IAQ61_007533 [Plenodomus lingam]
MLQTSTIENRMPLSPINDLPEELLESILKIVKETEYPTLFWNSLRTCQKWHRVGLGLYQGLGFATTVVIESDMRRNKVQYDNGNLMGQLETSLDLEIPSKLYLSLLKSLTIEIQHRRNTSLFTMPRNTEFLKSLEDIFAQTSRLTTFSIHFSDGWDYPNLDVPAVPQSWLARIIGVLPDSVIHLEIDSAGTDISYDPELHVKQREHLCYQVGKIITRLGHLRLRTGHVCSAMFGASFDGSQHNMVGCGSQKTSKDKQEALGKLISQWHMRALTIWIPWGLAFTLDTPFSRACAALLDPNLRNPTVILIVEQKDVYCPKRSTITIPSFPVNSKFIWQPHSNVPLSLRNALSDFRFATICGYTDANRRLASMNPTLCSRTRPEMRPCKECAKIRDAPTRHFVSSDTFYPPPEPDTTTSYPYIAIQTVENILSWTTNTHSSYRYPLSQADEPGKSFWRGADRWSCQLPGCGARSKSMVHLRGHQIYKHVNYTSFGELRCPSTGCDWIGGINGKDGAEYEAHVMEHHLEPCTLSKLDSMLDSVPLRPKSKYWDT